MLTDSGSGRRAIDDATVAAYRERGWWSDVTVVDDFLAAVADHPDAVATVSYRAGVERPERHTYAELELHSRRVAATLIDLGVGNGEVVSLQLPNGWEFPAIVYGILRVGAVVGPVVPILRHRELGFILERTGSSVLFVPAVWRSFDYAAMATGVQQRVASLATVVVVGDSALGDMSFSDDVVGRRWEDDPALDGELDRRRPAADDLAQIQFTSGTTGEPKGVLHSHNTIRSGCRPIDEILGLGADDVCFMASTLAHQTGFAVGMLKPLGMGATVVYQDVWDPDGLADAIEEERIVWTVSATPFVVDLVAAQRRQQRDLSSFRYFICGGAPVPPKVVEDARAVLGAELVAVWGMTENLIVTTTRPGDPVELVSDSDGTPVDHMEVRIVDDAGEAVDVGESGNLQVRGPNQALGYFRRPDLYEAASAGTWFDTGDVARLRPDGGIRIVGRTKDLIIRGGENVPVAEVEDLLMRHPAVGDVAVVGVPDERLGEKGCAVITTSSPDAPTLGQLTSFLEEQGMAKQFWPERLEIVDELPRTPSGKVQKFKLRQELR